MFVIIPAAEAGQDINRKLSEVFVDGFGHWLKYFSDDMDTLIAAFEHMFLPKAFFVALADGEVVGIAACTNGKDPSIRLNKKELCKHLGYIRGTLAFTMLRRELQDHPYPFPLDKDTGSIEFVATASKYRGEGVAFELIRHIFLDAAYNAYVLEVADTNGNAVKLYEKLGFTEIHRVKQKHPKQSGINFLVYMKYVKNG